MTTAHVPDDLLRHFVDCDVDERVAVHIASHLDQCPMCATRAASMEPLASVFAAVDDPIVPDALFEAILREASAVHRSPAVGMAVGVALLCTAVILLALGTDAGALVVGAGQVARALPSLGALVSSMSLNIFVLTLAFALFVGGSTFAIRRSRQEAHR